MRELLLVGGIMLALLAMGGLAQLSWQTLLYAGFWCTTIGLAFGVPTGAVYHVLLYRKLRPRGVLKKGWYWRTISFHELLSEREYRSVMRWFYVGGMGFLLIVLGFVLLGAGMFSGYLYFSPQG